MKGNSLPIRMMIIQLTSKANNTTSMDGIRTVVDSALPMPSFFSNAVLFLFSLLIPRVSLKPTWIVIERKRCISTYERNHNVATKTVRAFSVHFFFLSFL